MVGPVIDEKVQKFLVTLFEKGGHISFGIASTTENVLLSRGEDLSLKNVKTSPMWGRSILLRLGFRRRVDQSLPKITFSAKFSASVNEKHYSNTEEIVISYLNEERKNKEMLINMHY